MTRAELRKQIIEKEQEIATINSNIEARAKQAEDESLEVETRDKLIEQVSEEKAELEKAETRLKELKDEEAKMTEAEKRDVKPAYEAKETKEVTETREYELAWANYVRSGNDAELRSIVNTGTPSQGGYAVPTILANRIEDRMMNGGRIVSLCSITSIRGITSYPIVGSKTDPDVHPEQTALDGATPKKEKAITLKEVSIEPQFIAEILRTTDKFEADSIEAFFSWLMAELPDAILRKLDALTFTGLADGSQGVRGILTNTDTDFVRVLPTHTLNFNTANSAVALLDDGVESGFVHVAMNRKTFFNSVMGLTDTTGNPIFTTVSSSNLNRPAYFIGGYPVVFTDVLPAYADATTGQAYMVLGNFNAMRMNLPLGNSAQITRDATTEADLNFIRYISKIYVGGNITTLGSFVKVQK